MGSTRPCGISWSSAPPRLSGVRARLLALVVVASLGSAGITHAAPNDVIADYFVDGQLNGRYSVEDLRGALAFAKERTGADGQYSAFAEIVGEALTARLAGVDESARDQLNAQTPGTPKTPPAAPPPADAVVTTGNEGLPTPPATDPDGELPVAVPIMGFVALGLVAAGTGSAVWRRRRRG
jgi:hypothetical protein